MGGFSFGGSDFFHHLGNDKSADSVIECSADEAFIGEFGRAILIDGNVSYPDAELGDVFRR